MSIINDPNALADAGTQAAQSSAPPYVPFSSYTGVDPYSGQQNNLGAISTEMQYNTIFNPYYWNPSMQQTYTPIDANAPGTYQGYQPINPNGQQAYGTYINPNQFGYNPNSYVVDPNQFSNPGATGYGATYTGYAQGQVDPNSMVQNQMTQVLNSGDENGDGVPDWARPAVTSANQRMNSLGLGASTMTGNAQTTAILNAAMPMAVANAQVVAQLNSQNLSNAQQSMISNAAWDNAAKQFNAQSENQMTQFFSGLTAQIASQNAERLATMDKFYAGLKANIATTNAQMANDLAKFNSNLANQREEFNTQNQVLIDQSNVQWRRAVNTANTAGINSVNQANAANMFNMSQMAQNNLWQQSRDEASWALTASENSRNRMLSLVNSALNRSTSLQILASTLNANMFSQLGSFATNLLGGSFGSSLVNAAFGGSGSSSEPNYDTPGFLESGGFTAEDFA